MTSPTGKIFQQLLMLRYQGVGWSLSVRMASSTPKAKEEKLKIEAEPPKLGTNNWIGPPDPVSNIRPIKFQVHREETHAERMFRQKQAETIQWNQDFWHKHNSKFFKEKEEFVNNLKEIKGVKTVSPEELSQFYRSFLNENRKAHLQYNKEWYKRNISLLWPALQVAVIQAFRRMRESRNKSVKGS
ncbi:hypothetical protein BaRGS_00018518 [Batillaria attramentaria]|uniref:Apoptogenic protein 1, mitochondrial n=1 Tax=Batillaria attramentaria TaxID=370345 RepID=A0ABD0KTD2_9CAEN